MAGDGVPRFNTLVELRQAVEGGVDPRLLQHVDLPLPLRDLYFPSTRSSAGWQRLATFVSSDYKTRLCRLCPFGAAPI